MDWVLWTINLLFWIIAMPMVLLELWLTKKRAAKYAAALKQIADIPDTDAGHKQARNMARQLVYDWKW